MDNIEDHPVIAPPVRGPRISVLVSARKNSKYLSKFLFGYMANTHTRHDIHIMLNKGDTWNDELVQFFSGWPYQMNFCREDLQLGRAGLHEYFNFLLVHATGDWIAYFCEDHFISMPAWDDYVRSYISGERKSGDSAGKKFPLDPNDVWVIVPKFDNCGAMNHIVSRGFIKAMGDKLGRHGWIDSYINELMERMPDRVIRMDDETFHDFTHDQPSPMSDAHLQTVVSEKGKQLPPFESPEVRELITDDYGKLLQAVKN